VPKVRQVLYGDGKERAKTFVATANFKDGVLLTFPHRAELRHNYQVKLSQIETLASE
jgi:hypothetical protein